MARTITSAAQTELDKAQFWPIILVEIDWGGAAGAKTYASFAATIAGGDGVDAEARLVNIGTLTLKLEPQRVGGSAEVQVTLKDDDRTILGYARAVNPQLRRAKVYRFPRGLTYATDRITLLDGVVHGEHGWKEDGTYDLTLRDLGHLYLREIGKTVTKKLFPQSKEADDFV